MLTNNQVNQIKEHLEKAQNPLFFFDNDPDGLCSFIILQRLFGRGKGVPIKSFPELDESYFRKVSELNTDYIFILDKPLVSKEFFERVREINLPVVWIDHHEVDKSKIPMFVDYYNPLCNEDKKNEPVTALCYQANKNKDLSWLALVGCISDKFLPGFYDDFKREYPDLSIDSKDAFEVLYNSQIGKIERIFNFALKDRTTNVISMIKFLMRASNPYDVLKENSKNRSMHKRFEQIDSKYQKLLGKAIEVGKKSKNVLFFQFGGDLSISGNLSNEISHLFPGKRIVVAYSKGIYVNISARGKNIREAVLNAIEDLEDASGGGHEEAVGARVRVKDLEKFKWKLESFLSNISD